MNTKQDAKFLSALALILVIALAPVSTAVFAQDDTVPNDVPEISSVDDSSTDNNDIGNETRKEQFKEKMNELREQRDEKIQKFKEKIRDEYKDRLRTDLSPDIRPHEMSPDRQADLTFSGDASGWTIITGHAIESSTVLNGEAWHIRGDIWKIHSKATLHVGQRTVDVEFKGFANEHRLTLHGTGIIGEDPIRVFIRGHYAPTVEYGVFAIAFNQMGVQNQNTDAKFTMAQVGDVTVTPMSDVKIPDPLPYDAQVELFQ
ncbi:MAG: hypothetical protein ACE5RN_02625 [Nitrosopumilaceae archaeon]